MEEYRFSSPKAALRALLRKAFVDTVDIDRLVIDHFSDVKRYLSSDMSYERKINAILEAVDDHELLSVLTGEQDFAARCQRHPQLLDQVRRLLTPTTARLASGTDHRPISPPGTAYDTHTYVSRSGTERRAMSYLVSVGRPTVLWGAEQFGKTWLSERLAEQWMQINPAGRLMRVSLDLFQRERLQSYGSFLTELMLHLYRDLAVMEPQRGRTDISVSPNCRMTDFMNEMLRAAPGPLLLVIDRADAITPQSFCFDFFRMMRGWAEERRMPWCNLRILLAISTMPGRLTDDLSSSPFENLCEPIKLDPLDGHQTSALALVHGVSCDAHQAAALTDWLGGHPYLVRIALFEVALKNLTLPELLLVRPSSLFARHMSRLRRVIEGANLTDMFSRLVKGVCYDLNQEAFELFHRLGIIHEAADGGVTLRGSLYTSLLR